uniref:Small ribosomal subunit protein uS9c n=1 Tax=Pedobesia claviformis TaxID=2364088 RepID=A0A386B0T8_9CHLO|nr:ribosomal protein S9 [Pedobesia claviformis]AYC65309.1 ribosomal protein S9 [Pedobesia claviformis]
MNIYIGRRKKSIARVKLLTQYKKASIVINNLEYEKYFQFNIYQIDTLLKPFEILNINNLPNLQIKVSGGGLSVQSKACQLAIARFLQTQNSSYRQLLKPKDLLKQDSRNKERRKYGLKKARKAPQFSKR